MSILPPDLQAAVDRELADPRFAKRTHMHRKTYDAGCRGPLCSQAKSDHRAARYRRQIDGRPVRRYPQRTRRDELAPLLREYLTASRAS